MPPPLLLAVCDNITEVFHDVMTNPYEPPEATESTPELTAIIGWKPPVIGCGAGGCLIPTLLFIVCLVFGDIGGPLFWPILAVFLAVVGFVVGSACSLGTYAIKRLNSNRVDRNAG